MNLFQVGIIIVLTMMIIGAIGFGLLTFTESITRTWPLLFPFCLTVIGATILGFLLYSGIADDENIKREKLYCNTCGRFVSYDDVENLVMRNIVTHKGHDIIWKLSEEIK